MRTVPDVCKRSVAQAVLISTTWAGAGVSQPSLVINEVDYDQPGPDIAEWIELKSRIDTILITEGWELILYDGDLSGHCVEYCRVDLSPIGFIGEQGIVLIGAHQYAELPLCSSVDAIQNGSPDAIALFVNGILVDSVEYASDRMSTVCSYYLTNAVDSAVVPGSMSRCLGAIRWRFAVSTPGEENDCTTPTDVPEPPGGATFTLVKSLYR